MAFFECVGGGSGGAIQDDYTKTGSTSTLEITNVTPNEPLLVIVTRKTTNLEAFSIVSSTGCVYEYIQEPEAFTYNYWNGLTQTSTDVCHCIFRVIPTANNCSVKFRNLSINYVSVLKAVEES